MYHEMLSYHRWTAQLVMSVDIFSTAAQLYEKKTHTKWLAIRKWPWRSFKVIRMAWFDRSYITSY